jgi:O-antigen ligase
LASAELVTPATENLTPALLPGSRLRLIDSILLYGAFSLLLFGPLAFGAVEPWAIFVLSLGAASLCVLWVSRQVISGCLRVAPNPLFAPMLAFGVVLGLQLVLRTSAYQYATTSSALLYCVYAVLAFTASQFLQRTAQVKILAWLLSSYGFAVAVFAIVQSLSSNGKLYWVRTPRSGGWIYGPYVSHNHYAGLMEMLFPLALIVALSRTIRGNWKWAPAFAAVLMAGTIFLSGSRGGMIAFLAQMVVLGVVLSQEKNRRSAWFAAAVLLVIAALILWVGGQNLISRIASIHSEARSELDNGLRLRIDRDGLRMLARKPILGWGLGTFPDVYPQFRTFYTNKLVNRAHNDYLQMLVETGLLGFAAAAWFVFALYRGGLKKIHDWQWNVNGAVALAALLACTGILAHSFLDSNLQIPANAALFYVFATIAAADSRFGSHRRLRHHRRRGPTDEIAVSSPSSVTLKNPCEESMPPVNRTEESAAEN